jgi:hypothetical protein
MLDGREAGKDGGMRTQSVSKPLLPFVILLVLIAAVAQGGCNKSTHRKVVLISDTPWPVGEAKECSFDGKWNEMHCFPPEKASAYPVHKYMVDADFDKPVQFDKEQWAYDLTCRLDSVEHAMCRHQSEHAP